MDLLGDQPPACLREARAVIRFKLWPALVHGLEDYVGAGTGDAG